MANVSSSKNSREIDFLPLEHVDVHSVLCRGDDHQILLIVHLEELRLAIQWHLEDVDGFDALLHRLCEVQLQYPVLLHKDECGVVTLARLQGFEVKLNAHLVEDRDVFHTQPELLHELVFGLAALSRSSLEDEQLVWLLLLHDEVLSTNASDVLLVLGLSERNDLVRLPRLRLQESDWHLTDSLVL